MLSIIVGMNCVSFVLSFVAFRVLRSWDTRCRQRFSSRQMQHLFFWDMLNHFFYPCVVGFFYPSYGLSRFVFREHNTVAWVMCLGLRGACLTATMATLLFELHISVALTCRFFKSLPALRCLQTVMPFIGPVAFGLGVLQGVVNQDQLHPNMDTGVCVDDTEMPFLGPVILLTTLVSLSSYTMAARASLRAPHSVTARMWRLAMLYPLNVVLTTGCQAVGAVWAHLWRNPYYRLAVVVTMSMNGSVNALTYFFNSRYANSSAFRRAATTETTVHEAMLDTYGFSFNVVFSPEAQQLTSVSGRPRASSAG